MPTSDRTTIKATVDEFVSKLRTNLVADPPTSAQPFRYAEVGATGVEEYARPFLSVLIVGARPIGVVNDDKVMEATTTIRVVVDVTQADPHDALLDAVGAVDDYLDGIIDTGVIEGAEGFDDRAWTFDYPKTSAGARVAVATAKHTFVVKVERQQNRVPAP